MGRERLPAVLAGRWLAGMLILAGWLATQPASAQPGTRDGLFVTVPNPITETALRQIRQKVEDAAKGRTLTKIVFDFNPNELPAGTSSFGACNELAEFIQSLHEGQKPLPKVDTVAFVHAETTQHTVLPVLTCRQIIMSQAFDSTTHKYKAALGDIRRGQERELSPAIQMTYQKIAQDRALGDLVERMMNKDFVLKAVKFQQGVKYLGQASIAKLEQQKNVVFQVDNNLPPGLETGNALFDPETAHKIGLCQAMYNSRAEVAAALRLSHRSLAEDWGAGGVRVPWRIEVKHAIDKGSLDSLERRIKTAIGRNANFIILQLESPGGDTKHVASVANNLRSLKDENGNPIRIVAWVPPGASLGAATFLALGCSEIVMSESAVLGDFSYLQNEKDADLESRRAMLTQLAKEQGYPPMLFEATLDRNLALYRVRSTSDANMERLISETEYEKDKASATPQWRSLGRIDRPKGDFLKITFPLATEWGVANTTRIETLDELYAHYVPEAASKVRVARDDWLDRVAEFFREPIVNFILVMLGIVGLILEMKMPGTTVPGVLAAICFVLFFWAYSFVGEFTLLAVLLFVLGLIFIGVEVFVVPGIGFPGIVGLLLLITSLGLVTLERWPSTSQDWASLGITVGTFGFSMVAAVFAAIVLAWYLPNIPYANRLVLNPPEDQEDVEPQVPPSLLGAIGVAATTLRPAGKAQFGDDFLDVVAEGDYVNPGQRVQVIEIEGNRIVVKEIG